jgi:UDP-N-acetylglucosamine:LPS N-acetylglucosamine transferase
MCAIGETFSHYNAAETKHKSLNWTVKTETTTTCGDTNITTVDTGGCSGLPACTTFSVLQYKQNTAAIVMQNTVAGNTNRMLVEVFSVLYFKHPSQLQDAFHVPSYTVHGAQVRITPVSVLTAAAVRSMYSGFHVLLLLLSHF